MILLVATLVSASAYDYKVGDLCYNVNSDGATVTVVSEKPNGAPRYNSLVGAVTIPRMVLIENRPYTVTAIANDAFYYCQNITSVVIGDAVTTIGAYAFEQCTALKSVTFGKAVLKTGYGTFESCKALTDVDLGSALTEIGENTFNYCTALTSITFPSTLSKLGRGAFDDCSKLATISGGENVVSIGRDALTDTKWFYNQPNGVVYFGKVAMKIRGDVPSTIEFKEGTVSIGDYFVCSDYLNNVKFPSTLKYIGENSFEACRNLNNVTFPASLESIGSMAFDAALSFTEVDIPDNVTTIGGNAFSRSNKIKKLIIGKGVTSIGAYAFTSCTGLTDVYAYPNPDNVTLGKQVFSYSSASTATLHVKSEFLSKYETADQWKDFGTKKGDLTNRPDSNVKGDVNGDNMVNVTDVTTLVNCILGTVSPSGISDVDGNGTTNVSDVTYLVNLILGVVK